MTLVSRISFERRLIEKTFARADIRINGDRPFDIKVTDERFFRRLLWSGQLGIGEAYVDGWWDCERIDQMTERFIRAGLHSESLWNPSVLLYQLKTKLGGVGSKDKSFEVGRQHYDHGNDLFRAFLDERMVYSCAYWHNSISLDEAQEAKLDLVCRKLQLRPGMRVLDIGCGWGAWARLAAERYGVSVVGVTVSIQQHALAKQLCAGLPIEIRLCDYRDVNERFDRVVSIGMLEHVGHRHYGSFMRTVERCLNDDGLFALHSIFSNRPMGAAEMPWLTKYVFPNGELPSLGQVLTLSEKFFTVEALQHLDGDYEQTLSAWHEKFCANWPALKACYDDRFFRLWRYYLQVSLGVFMARLAHVWQIVFSKSSGQPGYRMHGVALARYP